MYITNLPPYFKETDLEKMLSKYGHVVSTKILCDAQLNSRGMMRENTSYNLTVFDCWRNKWVTGINILLIIFNPIYIKMLKCNFSSSMKYCNNSELKYIFVDVTNISLAATKQIRFIYKNSATNTKRFATGSIMCWFIKFIHVTKRFSMKSNKTNSLHLRK